MAWDFCTDPDFQEQLDRIRDVVINQIEPIDLVKDEMSPESWRRATRPIKQRDEPARMLAVLDRELSTLDDPLTDVGMIAIYWSEVGELLWRNRSPQPHRGNPGFPSVDVVVDRYASTSGRDVGHLGFYRALATFKLACIAEGAYARQVKSAETSRIAEADAVVRSLAGLALDAAKRLGG